MIRALCAFVSFVGWIAPVAQADDWPQWRGPNRDGVWNEKGILQVFPQEGLKIRWRAPIGGGISSPAVAKGRVYVTDALEEKPNAWERIHCFDEKDGTPLWTYSYEADYLHNYGFKPKAKTGPYSTPVVDAGKLYALGILGQVVCLDALTGKVV
jgi:outer membrane protein assembly factor BamB